MTVTYPSEGRSPRATPTAIRSDTEERISSHPAEATRPSTTRSAALDRCEGTMPSAQAALRSTVRPLPDERAVPRGWSPSASMHGSSTRSAAVPTLLELLRAHRDEHRLTRHAEHHHDERRLGVAEVVAVLVVDHVTSRLPERLAGVDDPLRFSLKFEDHLPFDHVTEGGATVAVRRQTRTSRREGDPNSHRLLRFRHGRGLHRRDDDELRCCYIHGVFLYVATGVNAHNSSFPARVGRRQSSSGAQWRCPPVPAGPAQDRQRGARRGSRGRQISFFARAGSVPLRRRGRCKPLAR